MSETDETREGFYLSEDGEWIPEGWEFKKLEQICFSPNERIKVSTLDVDSYFSTENILENFSGVTSSSGLPSVKQVSAFQQDDILFSNIRTYFKKLWISDRSGGCSNDVLIFRANKNTSSRFLFYYLQNDRFINYTVLTSKGTKMPRGDKHAINRYSNPIPCFEEQKAIAAVLSSLDDKIELLREQNETLEALAQTLFKRWFIDLNFPDQNGKPYKDSGGNMIPSELGEIPEGWNTKDLSEFGKIVCGKTPSKSNATYFGIEIPFIKIPDMHGNTYILTSGEYLSSEGAASQQNKTIPEGSIVVSCIATVGLVAITSCESQTNQQINSIVPYEDHTREYLYLRMKNLYTFMQNLGAGGSATLNINTTSFSKINITHPEDVVLRSFHLAIKDTFKKIKTNSQQIQTLTHLRDTLLPKLMKGEIRIKKEEFLM